MIVSGIYSNSMVSPPLKNSEESMLVPEGSFFRMCAANRMLFNRLISLITDCIVESSSERGKLLEEIMMEWIAIKLRIMFQTKDKFGSKFSVGSILGIKSGKMIGDLCNVIDEEFHYPDTFQKFNVYDPEKATLAHRLNAKKNLFLKHLSTCNKALKSVQIFKSKTDGNSGDCFDYLLILKDISKPQTLPILIFLELKSNFPHLHPRTMYDDIGGKTFQRVFHQHETFENLTKSIPKEFNDIVHDALRKKNYAYIYVTDTVFSPTFRQQFEVEKMFYIMSAKELQSFFGIMYDVYRSARSGMMEIVSNAK
jgi:hypothetical protein